MRAVAFVNWPRVEHDAARGEALEYWFEQFRLPEECAMPHLDDECVLLPHALQNAFKMRQLFGPDARGKLQQQRTNGIFERCYRGQKVFQLRKVGAVCMRDQARQFEAEPEFTFRHGVAPARHGLRIWNAIEGRVALDGIEDLRVAGEARRFVVEVAVFPAWERPGRQAEIVVCAQLHRALRGCVDVIEPDPDQKERPCR